MDALASTLKDRVVLTGAIAIAYAVTAHIGFSMALPPGNVTALWMPSGLALAVVLLFGRFSLLGVWLGSFAINWWSLQSLVGLNVAVAIATGSTLQAICAATLLQARLGHAGIPKRGRDVAEFMALMAVATLIASGIGVSALCYAGLAPWSEFLHLGWTWWLGDYAGILSFAPLLIVFGRRWLGKPVDEIELFPLTTLWFGVTLIAFFFVYQGEQRMAASLNQQAS